jgi:hypothetical protein
MNRDFLRQWVNILGSVLTLVVNGLANGLPLNGHTTGSISDQFKVYFVPAGYVFSIWGLIYFGLIAFAVYQGLPAQRENLRLRRIGYFFAVSCLANCAWIFLWHYELFTLTLVAMFTLLLSLIAIYLRLDIGRARASSVEKWCVDIPFSVYLGWITVATIANVSNVLFFLKWDGWGLSPEAWMVMMLVAATAIVSAVSLARVDIGYMLVIVWAFIGIAVKHADNMLVANTTWVMTSVIVLVTLYGVWSRRRGGERPLIAD